MTKEEHAKVLPPLPMPFIKLQGRNSRTKAQSEMMELFSADQMREYALAAIMRKEPEPCTWTLDDCYDMGDTYDSSCGEKWSFIDGGPEENRVRFCHGCGKPVSLSIVAAIGGVK